MTDNTSLTQKPKMPIPGQGFKKGIAANREQANSVIEKLDPNTVPNRIGLVFDDSGSMAGQQIEDAKIGVKNFTQASNYQDTSIALYPLNKDKKPLTVDYDILNLFVLGLTAGNGTPLYTKLVDMIDNEKITRAVVFSDGSPTDSKLLGSAESWDSKPKDFAVSCITKYTDKEVPIDTIFIGQEHDSGYKEMQEIARLTNGVFVHFTDTNKLAQNLKYLAPRYRALLTSADLKEKIQKGETV